MIANTADDDEFWSLLVCPDIDAVIYRLGGVFNEAAGYGVKGDTFRVLDALRGSGGPDWFQIGDLDFATHIDRTSMLRGGKTLTQATAKIASVHGVTAHVLPMTDESVRTRFATEKAELSFQEYFVLERLRPQLKGIRFEGIDSARPTPEVLAALADADVVIIGPSNPLISVAPILRLVRDHMPRERTVAVTPIVGGLALKGPTIEMMRALGPEPNPVEVARLYGDVAATFVVDRRDAASADAIEGSGQRVLVLDTVMKDGGERLASAILGELGHV